MSQAEPKTATRTSSKIELREPPMFRVIYMNDNTTSMDFVVSSLIEHFQYTQPTAEKITGDIHESGSAVVAILPYEIAEQKGIEITFEARAQNYPLQIKLEPDNA